MRLNLRVWDRGQRSEGEDVERVGRNEGWLRIARALARWRWQIEAMTDADKILVAQIRYRCVWALHCLFRVQQHSAPYTIIQNYLCSLRKSFYLLSLLPFWASIQRKARFTAWGISSSLTSRSPLLGTVSVQSLHAGRWCPYHHGSDFHDISWAWQPKGLIGRDYQSDRCFPKA